MNCATLRIIGKHSPNIGIKTSLTPLCSKKQRNKAASAKSVVVNRRCSAEQPTPSHLQTKGGCHEKGLYIGTCVVLVCGDFWSTVDCRSLRYLGVGLVCDHGGRCRRGRHVCVVRNNLSKHLSADRIEIRKSRKAEIVDH